MNRVLGRILSLALVLAFSGLALPAPSFTEAKKQVRLEEYERLLADAQRKGCTQVKGCR